MEFYGRFVKKSTLNENDLLNELKTLSFYDFKILFKDLDQTQKELNNKYQCSNSELAKAYCHYGKETVKKDPQNKIDANFKIFLVQDSETEKTVFDVKKIEDYFVTKNNEFIKDMFNLSGRKQLAGIGYDARVKEIKDFSTKMNRENSKFLLFLAKYEYQLELKYIDITYKIAKRKLKEMHLLITNNGETFYLKSKDKNLETFKTEKALQKNEIKMQIKNLDSTLTKIEQLKAKSTIYATGKDYSYDYEVKSLKQATTVDYLGKKEAIGDNFKILINEAKTKLLNVQSQKEIAQENTKKEIALANENFKNDLVFSATKSELKNLKFQNRQEIKEIKNQNTYVLAKSNLSYLKHQRRVELKKCHTTYISELENITNNYPTFSAQWKTYVAPLASIIPGMGQIINHQFKKGLIMMLMIPFIVFFMLYGFGIGNVGGNGILGLIDFGNTDPANNDGRFYLIEGIIGLILIVVSLLMICMSIIDAKNVAQQMYIGGRPSTWSQTRSYLKTQGTPYLLSLPAIIGILFIVLVPIIATFIIAFTDYGKGFDPARPGQAIHWIGFENFAEIFGGKYATSFGYVLGWTLLWVIFATFGAIIAGTIAALLVNNDRLKGKGFFRLILILPWAVPAFIMIMMFSLLLANKDFNEFTKKIFGVDGWTREQTQARVALIFIQSWLGQSYLFLLITGVLQGISKDLYDSSMMDGANKWKRLIKITIPIVVTQIAPLLVGQFTFNFGNFGIFSLYGANGVAIGPDGYPYPGNPGITDIIISFVYKLSTEQQSYTYGVASAFIIISSVFVVGISATGFKNMKAFKN